jgi:hypothetical protein
MTNRRLLFTNLMDQSLPELIVEVASALRCGGFSKKV